MSKANKGPSKDYRATFKKNNKGSLFGWYKCAYCGKNLRFKNADVDHIWPKSRGGSNASWNLTIACQTCNRSKGNRIDRRVLIGYLGKIFG